MLVVHPAVGATIDLEEKIHYKLFPEIYNFHDAQFLEYRPDTIQVRIRTWSEGGTQIIDQFLTPYQFMLIAAQVQRTPDLTQKERESIHKRFQPLFTDKFVAAIPENSYCRIRLSDKTQFDGVYYRMKGEYLQFWRGQQLKSVPKMNIVRLKYWDTYRQRDIVKVISALSFATLTFLVTDYLVDFVPLSPQDKALACWGSASLACIPGYNVAWRFDEYLSSATVIEFRTSKIKRLDTVERTVYTLEKIKDRIWQLIADFKEMNQPAPPLSRK